MEEVVMDLTDAKIADIKSRTMDKFFLENRDDGLKIYRADIDKYDYCEIAEIDGVCINGLMCVAPICEKEAELRAIFSDMRRLFIDIGDKKTDNVNMNVLSMGMSGDYESAILEGANLVRIGSAIFGARIYR